jgi:hypothetical protein
MKMGSKWRGILRVSACWNRGRTAMARSEPALQFDPGRCWHNSLSPPVWSNNSCGPAIILEQTSEPLAICSGLAAFLDRSASGREKQFVPFPLVIPFIIMSAELGQGALIVSARRTGSTLTDTLLSPSEPSAPQTRSDSGFWLEAESFSHRPLSGPI